MERPSLATTHLDHEALDDAMEEGALIVKRLAGGLADARLAGAQVDEVFRGLRRDLVEELDDHAALQLAVDK